MRALCNREALLTAFGMVSGVVPARSPKPILQNVKLIAEADEGSVLMGTDLEVGIRHRVLGVKVEQPGSVILPTVQIGSILRTSTDSELTIDTNDERLVVRGLHSEFTLPVEDANLFPEPVHSPMGLATLDQLRQAAMDSRVLLTGDGGDPASGAWSAASEVRSP